MQMGVVEKSLSPCVEHREESDLRPQMLGIGRNGAQCLAGRPKQNVVDDVLILKGNGCDWLRHSEDHMEILGVEKLGSTIIQPLGASQRLAFWAVAISARIITDALVVTAITVLDVAAKRRGSTQLNGAHDRLRRSGGTHPRLPARSGPPAPTQKCFGGVGFGSAGTRCGSRSRGLDVAQTLLVAIRKYLAVVARLR